MTVINLRGTNASGKSTIARQFLSLNNASPIYGVLGPRQPEAYRFSVPGVRQPLFVIGPYQINIGGGCDHIRPYDLILKLLDKYAARGGDVVFEGSLVSDHFGKVGHWLTARGRNATVMFLDTPLETCLERLRTRTANAGVKNVGTRFDAIQRVRQKFIAAGKVRVVDASCDGAYGEVLRLLNER